MCYVHIAALVAEYLFRKSKLPFLPTLSTAFTLRVQKPSINQYIVHTTVGM